MKFFALFISALFISLNIFAQEPDSILAENWSLNDSVWENNLLTVYTYSNEHLIKMTWKNYNTNTDSWINEFKIEYIYSSEGNIAQTIRSFWEEGLNDWRVDSKTDYTYDASGNQTTSTMSTYEDGQWQPASISVGVFNSDDRIMVSTRQIWDPASESYLNSVKTLFSYDSNDNQINVLYQNFVYSEWINWTQTTTQYTSFNEWQIVTRQYWNGDTQEWINNSKKTFTYDQEDLIVNSQFHTYNTSTQIWKLHWQENYTNNIDGTVHQIVFQQYLSDIDDWENDTRTTFSYLFSTAVSNIDPLIIALFPNPSTSIVKIHLGETAVLSTYIIMDMSGKILARDLFYGQNAQVSTDHLAPGIYILEVETNGKTGIVKIVRE